MSNVINLAQTLVVDGINAASVKLPGRLDNMGEKARDYTLLFHAPDADKGDDNDRANNALRVEVGHNRHRKAYEVEVRPIRVHRHGYSMMFDFRKNDTITLATIPTGRYSAKALDALAEEWLTKIAAEGMPTNEHTADLWATIVESHGVARPALTPAAV